MKITIASSSVYLRNQEGYIWDNTAKCVMAMPCRECILYPIVKDNCLEFRKSIVNATNTSKLPYTIDTNDFPELFI